jgi:phenylalanyl-tRNA synthetase alpha chain
VYHLNEKKVLRNSTTESLLLALKEQTPPCKLYTLGKVYRPAIEDATHSKVFYQLEVMEICKKATKDETLKVVEMMLTRLFGDVEIRYKPFQYPGFSEGLEFEIFYNKNWISLGGCGFFNKDLLAKCNADFEKHSGFSIGFGVDRMAMVKFGISEIKEVYQVK